MYTRIVRGAREALLDRQPEFFAIGSAVALVRKQTGDLELELLAPGMPIWDKISAMTFIPTWREAALH